MNNLLQQTDKKEVKEYLNKIVKPFIDKNRYDNIGEIEHVIDYLNTRKNLDNILKIPYLTCVAKSKVWIEKLNQSAAKITETEDDIKVIKDFNDGFKFVQIVSKDSYQREGKLMSHCVSSYFGKDALIYSLRDVNNNPHCTLEVNKNDINQIKGKGNGLIHPKYIKYVLRMLKILGKEIRESELTYLGYQKLSDSEMIFLENNFKGLKTLTFNNKRFVYNLSKLLKR